MSIQIYFTSSQPLEAAGNPGFTFTIYPDGTIDDGGADDNFCIFPLENEVHEGEITYRAELQMSYTEGRARQVIEYIKGQLKNTDEVRLWNEWLDGSFGDDDDWEAGPRIIRREVYIEDLAPEDLREFLELDAYSHPMKLYCLEILA